MEKSTNNESFASVFLHLLFVGSVLALPYLSSPDFPNLGKMLSNPFGAAEMFSMILICIFTYLNYYVLIPRYYFPKRLVLYVSIVVSFILFVDIIPFLFRQFLPMPAAFMHPPIHQAHNHWWHVFRHLITNSYFYMAVLFSLGTLMLRIIKQWQKVEKEKTEAELSYLKAQINPHFLFNMLNGIYSLALADNSLKTAAAVVRLSYMMRFVLTEADQKFVELAKEIEYLASYIEMQKLRLGETVRMEYKVTGNLNGKKIAPLILISYIENAIKHGVTPEQNSEIEIDINCEEERVLKFYIRNTKVLQRQNGNREPIGLKNSQSRLEMMYPDKHKLKITDTVEHYLVELELDLHD